MLVNVIRAPRRPVTRGWKTMCTRVLPPAGKVTGPLVEPVGEMVVEEEEEVFFFPPPARLTPSRTSAITTSPAMNGRYRRNGFADDFGARAVGSTARRVTAAPLPLGAPSRRGEVVPPATWRVMDTSAARTAVATW